MYVLHGRLYKEGTNSTYRAARQNRKERPPSVVDGRKEEQGQAAALAWRKSWKLSSIALAACQVHDRHGPFLCNRAAQRPTDVDIKDGAPAPSVWG